MEMGRFNDAQVSTPDNPDSNSAFNHFPQSKTVIQQSPSILSFSEMHHLKKPGSFEPMGSSNPGVPLHCNRSKLSVPFKSELCVLFQRGKCYFGENCHFSHGISEIGRKPGSKSVAVDGHLNENSKRYGVGKAGMKVCYWFLNGKNCPYGNNCQYLHECNQKVWGDAGSCRDHCALRAQNGESVRRGSGPMIDCRRLTADEDHDKLVFHKTELCKLWERFGSCPYGVKCRYAHGRAEIKQIQSFAEPKYCSSSHLKLSSKSNYAASCDTGTEAANKLQLKGQRCFMKWDIEKISQIYADWVEDRTNMHVASDQVRS